MGGGNRRQVSPPNAVGGLSPRGRGKPWVSLRPSLSVGSIPAWAGETRHDGQLAQTDRVYPRVGGGNGAATGFGVAWAGLSPRGRGKLMQTVNQHPSIRSIPAWAGETLDKRITMQRRTVYPRVGGGNLLIANWMSGAGGLSPRGRGKRAPLSARRASRRSIPAWAGETREARRPYPYHAVYPRVGGGNDLYQPFHKLVAGLSPRGRGKRCV